jgi:cyclase
VAIETQEGLNRVSDRVYAYMQFGGWGFNNTALFVDHGAAMLVDTTCDLPRMNRMLGAMTAAEPAAQHLDSIVLTHWHVDHVHGICSDKVKDTPVYATEKCADWMANLPPKAWVAMIESLPADAKAQIMKAIGNHFDFAGLEYREPDEIFTDRIELSVGDCRIDVMEMAPAHTASDTLVHFPDESTIHIGDLISAGRHQGVQWPHPSNFVKACDVILSTGAETIIPGHGRLLDRGDVANAKEYMEFMVDKARTCFDKGMTFEQAYDVIVRNLGPYRHLRNPQSLYFLCKMAYREFEGNTWDHVRRNYPEYLRESARIEREFEEKYAHLLEPKG